MSHAYEIGPGMRLRRGTNDLGSTGRTDDVGRGAKEHGAILVERLLPSRILAHLDIPAMAPNT
ncbi:hypothetical protein [Mycobacterium xenopi]|nr:hypothetical protein [Mycobacterium xenopi]MDA3639588.1 hypothetical protein [Mycobacterium xenopi]ORX20469.1 hypothetical protein AWC32_05490 [Mycobacterium xenopi]